MNDILVEIKATGRSGQTSEQITKLATIQAELMESCFLPRLNETWFREKIQPLWAYILSATELPEFTKGLIGELLDALVRSFQAVLLSNIKTKKGKNAYFNKSDMEVLVQGKILGFYIYMNLNWVTTVLKLQGILILHMVRTLSWNE